MVGDTWRDDIIGAVEAGSRGRWVDREDRASHARRFIAARELGDACPDRRKSYADDGTGARPEHRKCEA